MRNTIFRVFLFVLITVMSLACLLFQTGSRPHTEADIRSFSGIYRHNTNPVKEDNIAKLELGMTYREMLIRLDRRTPYDRAVYAPWRTVMRTENGGLLIIDFCFEDGKKIIGDDDCEALHVSPKGHSGNMQYESPYAEWRDDALRIYAVFVKTNGYTSCLMHTMMDAEAEKPCPTATVGIGAGMTSDEIIARLGKAHRVNDNGAFGCEWDLTDGSVFTVVFGAEEETVTRTAVLCRLDEPWLHEAGSDGFETLVFSKVPASTRSEEISYAPFLSDDVKNRNGLPVSDDLFEALAEDRDEETRFAVTVFLPDTAQRPDVAGFSYNGRLHRDIADDIGALDRQIEPIAYYFKTAKKANREQWPREQLVDAIVGYVNTLDTTLRKYFNGYLNEHPADGADYDIVRLADEYSELETRREALKAEEETLLAAYRDEWPTITPDPSDVTSLGLLLSEKGCPADCYIGSSCACLALTAEQFDVMADRLREADPDALGSYYFTLACRADFPTGEENAAK